MPQHLLSPSTYTKALGLVRSYVLKNSGCLEDVQDVFHEGLLIFLKKVESKKLILTCKPESYILGICKRIWLKEISKQQANVFVDSLEDIEDNHRAIVESNQRKELLIGIIRENIKKLSQKCQDVFRHKRNGLSCEQIARIMNLDSEQVSRNKMYTCKKRLLVLIHQDVEYRRIVNNE